MEGDFGVFLRKLEERGKPRPSLWKEIMEVFNKRNLSKRWRSLNDQEKMILSSWQVAYQKVKEGKWQCTTAVSQMDTVGIYLERSYPGIRKNWIWKNGTTDFKSMPRTKPINIAPVLSKKRIAQIINYLPAGSCRALYYLALITCARIGNLPGLLIKKITSSGVMISWEKHKTCAKIGRRRLFLHYWNADMKKRMMAGLRPGLITVAQSKQLEKLLKKLKVMKHSARRTGAQVYADCGYELEKIRTITLHSSINTLLKYVNYHSPTACTQAGPMASLAPFIRKKL